MGLTESHPRYILWAAQDGRLDDLLYHLEGAEPGALQPSSFSPKRQAPIHLAAIGGHTKCIQVLREAGSKLNERDKDGYSPIHLAVAHCHFNSVKTLLHLGANVDIRTRFNITPIHIAASMGHTPLMEELVHWGADVNAQESWGQTPLIIATLKGRVHCMKALIHLGADTEMKDYHHKNTALHIACSSKDEESVLVMLDASADVLAVNGQGQSSLGVALVNKFYSLVPLLVEYGAKLNEKDRENLPLMLQNYIDSITRTPLSLLRLSRVSVRQLLGPALLDSVVPTLDLPEYLHSFMRQTLELCNDSTVKQVALRGESEEYWKEQELANGRN